MTPHLIFLKLINFNFSLFLRKPDDITILLVLTKLSPPEFSFCFIMLIFVSHLILLSTVITACTTYTNIQKFSILPTQCIYLFCMILTINTVLSLNNINGLAVAMKKHCVYCAVGFEVHKVYQSCNT